MRINYLSTAFLHVSANVFLHATRENRLKRKRWLTVNEPLISLIPRLRCIFVYLYICIFNGMKNKAARRKAAERNEAVLVRLVQGANANPRYKADGKTRKAVR